MRLKRIAWEPQTQQYLVTTDTGSFLVPSVPGGWAQRRPWPYHARGFWQSVTDPIGIARTLGIVLADEPAPHLGCNCISRR